MHKHFFRIILAVLVAIPVMLPAFGDSLDGYPSLRESFDPELQQRLQSALESLGLHHAVADQTLAMALVDISDLEDPRMASVNGDQMMYAASLPKIAILLGAFVEIERSNMVLDQNTHQSLSRMIKASSNVEATRMLNQVGQDNLLEMLQSNRFQLYDPAVNGGLWVGKEYAKSPAYRRDPLHNLSHGATALQTARFYYLLETNQLVDPKLSRQMKAIMANSEINHKFVKGLSGFPDLNVYRKSGSWSRWHSDSALVEAGDHKYIIVGLVEHPQGGRWLSRIAKRLHPLMVSTPVPTTVAAAQ